MKTTYLIAAFVLLCGCSQKSTSVAPEPVGRDIDYIELFMSRASSDQTEFEQFKVSPGGIYMECGEVLRGRPKPESQEFKNASQDLFSSLSPLVEDIIATVKSTPIQLDKPGKSNSMFDPGILTLGLGVGNDKVELTTSVNAVADADDILERKIKRLVQEIRGSLGNNDCGKNNFYGIAPTQ